MKRWSWILICTACWLAPRPALAQLPEAPKPIQTFSMSVGGLERYSLTRSIHEFSPQISVDYRMTQALRLSVAFAHTFTLNPADTPPGKVPPATQGNNVVISLNYKMLQWGKQR